MARDDTGFLVVAGSVAGEFEDLGGEVFEHGCEVYCTRKMSTRMKGKRERRRTGSTRTDALGVVALLQVTVDTADGELEPSLGGARLGLGVGAAGGGLASLGFARFARHCWFGGVGWWVVVG